MALESFKRVQALKAERNKLAAELEERATADVSRILKSLGDDFFNFLSQEGFRVTRLKNAIGAIYGDARLSLEFPLPQERFSDALTVLTMGRVVDACPWTDAEIARLSRIFAGRLWPVPPGRPDND